jgi:CBS domain-containing protein
VANWIGKAQPNDILNADIFFDGACVHGDPAIASDLKAFAMSHAAQDIAMLKLMAEESASLPASTTFLGGFKTLNGRMDLKRLGLFPIVAGARVLALRHKIAANSTSARLEALETIESLPKMQLSALRDAHKQVLTVMLEQQIRDVAAGIPPSNRVDPKLLDPRGANRLKRALSVAAGMPDIVRANLF